VTTLATLAPLQATSLALAAIGATAVVFCRDILRQALLNALYGYTLVALFMVLQAPDVAMSMLVVSGAAYPLVLLIAIARVRAGKRKPDEES
jgi:energy-converting hydrogenase B subunit D